MQMFVSSRLRVTICLSLSPENSLIKVCQPQKIPLRCHQPSVKKLDVPMPLPLTVSLASKMHPADWLHPICYGCLSDHIYCFDPGGVLTGLQCGKYLVHEQVSCNDKCIEGAYHNYILAPTAPSCKYFNGPQWVLNHKYGLESYNADMPDHMDAIGSEWPHIVNWLSWLLLCHSLLSGLGGLMRSIWC